MLVECVVSPESSDACLICADSEHLGDERVAAREVLVVALVGAVLVLVLALEPD